MFGARFLLRLAVLLLISSLMSLGFLLYRQNTLERDAVACKEDAPVSIAAVAVPTTTPPRVQPKKSSQKLKKTSVPQVNYRISALSSVDTALGGSSGGLLPKIDSKVAVEDQLLTRLGSKLFEEQGGFSISPGTDVWKALGEGNGEFEKLLKDFDFKRPPVRVEYRLFF